MNIEAIREQLKRPCVRYEIGGFRPSNDPLESWFGRVNVCASGEKWPVHEGQLLLPLCQINVRQLPVRPDGLVDIDLITVFIDGNHLPYDVPNGQGWCLRTYKNLDSLVSLKQPDIQSSIKAFPMRATAPSDDYPCREDIPIELPDDVMDNYYDLFENLNGFKLGGWPTLIQSEIFWTQGKEYPSAPDFVFQIDSTAKANWCWGDSGVGYFGRGTEPGHEDEWTLEWQCF